MGYLPEFASGALKTIELKLSLEKLNLFINVGHKLLLENKKNPFNSLK
jgi:hypothetical protein